MYCNKRKLILLFSALFILLVAMQASFAADNDTVLSLDNAETLSVNDYYFDANAHDDSGDGSISNPYKTLNSTRILSNSTIHLANGEYDVDDYVQAANITFIGTDRAKTIVNSLNLDIEANSIITLKNITFNSIHLYSNGNLTLENSVLNSSSITLYADGSVEDAELIDSSLYSYNALTANNIKLKNNSYFSSSGKLTITEGEFVSSELSSNSQGYMNDSTFKNSKITVNDVFTMSNVSMDSGHVSVYENLTASNCVFRNSNNTYGTIEARSDELSLTNCIFENNHAEYGGAIYINGGILTINDCTFKNNNATNWGGAICAEKTDITLKKSRFSNNNGKKDAGGAIYLQKSSLNSDSVNITASSATFGSAITALISNVTINKLYALKNTAKYYGGAIYCYGGNFTISNSQLEGNRAKNGGALYADNVDELTVAGNKFISNAADEFAGAVYSIISNTTADKITDKNTFTSNKAKSYNDLYFSDSVSIEFYSGNYTFVKINFTDSKLPSSYRSPYVTPVKNQGNSGNCWAFTSLAAFESALMKATGTEYDLSENNMKNIMSLYSRYGWKLETNLGAYDDMGYGYLAGWLGPVFESDEEYNPKSLISPLLDPVFHVQNILFIQRDNQTDTKAIKEAVYKYGAVGTCIYWSGSYNKNGNYYYTGSSNSNHAVTIIGWDDNYSKDNFKTKPAGDGAWIIKNSWGTDTGNKGFYYVSYYDTRIAYAGRNDATFAIVLNDSMRYDKNYQYDVPGKTDYMINYGDVIWYKNRYTASDNEYLAAVSTYFQYPTNWTLSVYVNDALKLTQPGRSPTSYSTISLDKLISLKKGDIFEIVFNSTDGRGETSFPISEILRFNYEFYKPGISFVSSDGKTWTDLYDYSYDYSGHTYNSQVACIKAFTIFDKLTTKVSLNVSFNSLNTVDVVAVVNDQYGNIIKAGEVTFNIDKTTVKAKIIDGYAKITHKFKNSGQDTVKVSFSGDGYVSSSAEAKFNLTTIVSANITSYYDKVAFEITLKDKDLKGIADRKIIFSIEGKNYTAITDSNGKASVEMSLNIGKYNIKTTFPGDKTYMMCTVSNVIETISTISIPSQETYTYNAPYSVSLTDLNGNPLKNTNVNIRIGSSSYASNTDANGLLSISVKENPGNYTVTVTNPKSTEELNQSIQVVERICENKDLTMYFKAGKSYMVKVLDDAGNPLKGANVTFKINKRTYVKTTDENGYASLKISLNPNTYSITASYNGYTVKNKVVVKTTIITKDITVKKGKTIKFKAKLLSSKGKILKNKKITFKFKGKTYKVKTSSKGIATLKITKKYKAGKYTITSTYNGLKVKNKIKIKK